MKRGKGPLRISLTLLFTIGLSTAHATEIVLDGGFEAGTPNPFWSEYSIEFGTPLCTVADCGFGTGTGPHTGDWWAWFGGSQALLEVASLSQLVTIPTGKAELSFWFEHPSNSPTGGFLSLSIDDVLLWDYGGESLLGVPGYTRISVNIDDFADGGSHNVEFYAETRGLPAVPEITNFFVDDVSILSTVPNPPAAWLFGTGLVGLWGVARKRANDARNEPAQDIGAKQRLEGVRARPNQSDWGSQTNGTAPMG